jgi:hypothetical protein
MNKKRKYWLQRKTVSTVKYCYKNKRPSLTWKEERETATARNIGIGEFRRKK